MLAGVPVLAANEGGPLETVVEGETGWLRDVRKPHQWTEVLAKVLLLSQGDNGKRLLANMGKSGRERVVGIFSQESMAASLDQSLDALSAAPRFKKNAKGILPSWFWAVLIVVVGAIVLGLGLTELLFFALGRSGEVVDHEKGAAAVTSVVEETLRTVPTIMRRTSAEL